MMCQSCECALELSCSNLRPCFFFVSVDCSRLIEKKRSQTTRLSNQPEVRQRTATLHNKPASAPTTAQRNHAEHPLSAVRKCAALRETEVYNARIPCRSKNIPHRRAPARTSKPGWREKHQYQQQQIYLVSCLLWKRVTTTAEVYAFRSACQCSCHRGTISSLRD